MRILFLFLSFALLFGNTEQNIKKNEQKLQNISKEQNAINAKLKTLGANINSKNKKIKELTNQIKSIESNINANQKLYLEQEAIFNEQNKNYDELNKKLEFLQKELVETILKDMSIIMILNSKEPLSEESIISEEILKNLNQKVKQDIEKLISEREVIKKDITNVQNKITSAQKIIASQKEKKEILQIAKNEQLSLANKLNDELESYNNEFKQLDKERVGIQKILVSLNILKKQELENQEKKRKELKNTQTNISKNGTIPPLEVRQIGSSYRNISTAKYKGAKTIAPLKNYNIETKYGPYFDPVYKMRVFNEFITFSVKNRSNVLAVLDGKIVFAKDTLMLKKVIIIEHSNGLHTIYSYLDDIKDDLEVGSKVKKGSTIAWITNKLNFEVTQKDKHIDPLELIKAK
ncbi:MAG: peptidoglycan DD-metalloendopeptidase family protein [Helicobacteraceae bacterium]|nr:peptidoglycan DD-metalloendopeptidase family protein [Helicobacteraceae bacterium]